ncbi:MAG: acyl-ACP--UDP-N-acetylglucosamine O-acyltransferase [Holosporales bacterium]
MSEAPAIHPTAILGKDVVLGQGVRIGAYSVLEGTITLGDHVTIHSHAVISGTTSIGAHSTVFPFAVVGVVPQDLKYKGEASRVEIGHHTTIREHATIHAGTAGGGFITKVGNHCLLMVGVHVAHDCVVGDHVIMANNATLAGHVEVGEHAIIGGLAAVHQFVRIGKHAMIGGLSGVEHDVLPFATVMGDRAHLAGLNIVGLKRRGFARDDIHALRHALQGLFDDTTTVAEALEKLRSHPNSAVQDMVAFLNARGSRQLCRPATTTTFASDAA